MNTSTACQTILIALSINELCPLDCFLYFMEEGKVEFYGKQREKGFGIIARLMDFNHENKQNNKQVPG